MIQHQIDLTIHRPVEEVFAFLTNAANHPKWDSTSILMEPQEPGLWHTGIRFREVRKLGGRNTEVASQIAYLEPNRRFNIASLTGPEWRGQWLFEPVAEGTRLQFEGSLTFKGIMRLFEPFIAGGFKLQLDENFARLKDVLENAP
jgi:uncharacterized protein YndB with AHSA1/START domain